MNPQVNQSHVTYASAGVGVMIADVVAWLASTFFPAHPMPNSVAISVGGLIALVAGRFFHEAPKGGLIS